MTTDTLSPQRFMLIFRNAGADTHAHLTPDQRVALAKQWNDWYDGLAARGKAQQGSPLELHGRVVSGAGVSQRVIDGPYAEAKEIVGGFIVLSVAHLDEATEIATHCPGLPLGLTVEIRPLAPVSPVLDGVHGRDPI
jgi:hypothetical protein